MSASPAQKRFQPDEVFPDKKLNLSAIIPIPMIGQNILRVLKLV